MLSIHVVKKSALARRLTSTEAMLPTFHKVVDLIALLYRYVTYFMDRITMLQRNSVIPYVVFDGGPLPMKKGTEEERRKSRQKNRELGIQHFKNKRFREARQCFARGADVSPYMAHRVILVRMDELLDFPFLDLCS